MEEIKFSDFKIIPDYNSVHKEGIDDNTYFGDKYKKMVSNSRLKWINPEEGGSPALFKEPPKLKTQSLSLGSAIHQCVLEFDKFELAPKVQKPTAKLGMVMDNIDRLLHSKKEFTSFNDLVKTAALKADYYSNTVDSKLDFIKSTWYDFSPKLDKLRSKTSKKLIVLSDSDWDTANACINSLKSNDVIENILFPKDVFGDSSEYYCEDALFIDFAVIYQDRYCAVLPFKMKIDNWNINTDTQTIYLNDIKTSGKSINYFMEPGGSWDHYHYYRQIGVYLSILELYVAKELGLSTKNGWKFEANICGVETIPNYWSKCFKIPEEQLHRGITEFSQLMKRVAYYEMFGYDAEVNFV